MTSECFLTVDCEGRPLQEPALVVWQMQRADDDITYKITDTFHHFIYDNKQFDHLSRYGGNNLRGDVMARCNVHGIPAHEFYSEGVRARRLLA